MTGNHGTRPRALGALAAAGIIGAIFATSAAAQPDKPLLALAKLELGLWQVRELGNERAEPESICIADPAVLMQLQHRQSPCTRLVIANEAESVTVHYTCPANGFGRTSLRVETPRLVKIDSQGVFEKAPFNFRAEAKRLGPCAGKGAASR